MPRESCPGLSSPFLKSWCACVEDPRIRGRIAQGSHYRCNYTWQNVQSPVDELHCITSGSPLQKKPLWISLTVNGTKTSRDRSALFSADIGVYCSRASGGTRAKKNVFFMSAAVEEDTKFRGNWSHCGTVKKIKQIINLLYQRCPMAENKIFLNFLHTHSNNLCLCRAASRTTPSPSVYFRLDQVYDACSQVSKRLLHVADVQQDELRKTTHVGVFKGSDRWQHWFKWWRGERIVRLLRPDLQKRFEPKVDGYRAQPDPKHLKMEMFTEGNLEQFPCTETNVKTLHP